MLARLLVPQAAVLGALCAVVWIRPEAAPSVMTLGSGATLLVAARVTRAALSPLRRLVNRLDAVDAGMPRPRVPVERAVREIAEVADAVERLLDRQAGGWCAATGSSSTNTPIRRMGSSSSS